jgi:uncharacterized membrane protein
MRCAADPDGACFHPDLGRPWLMTHPTLATRMSKISFAVDTDSSTGTTPAIRSVAVTRPLHWLLLGWQDMQHCGWISLAHGLVLSLAGAGIVAVFYQHFWLLAGALSGFLLVAPVLATSLYALSRARERGERTDLRLVLKTWLNWQHNHFNKWSNDYWCLVQFGALLALAGTGWVVTSAALITLLAPGPVQNPIDFVQNVVLARNGFLFELWLAVGGVLAAPIFASSVIAIPLLLDRRLSLLQAVIVSWKVVLANPATMAFWAALIMALTLLGMGTFMLGLIAVIPLLGHASWHAYRDLVDASVLSEREPL